MDTPTIAEYYREPDPMVRKKLLDKSIEAGEEPENNAIRRELWEMRYSEASEGGAGSPRADGYLKLWMTMEFNRNQGERFFGSKSAVKDIRKHLQELKFDEIVAKGPQYEALLHREFCHLIWIYMDLCEKDRSYNSVLFGLMPMKKDSTLQKIKGDIYSTAVKLPKSLGLEKELAMITKAAREMYALRFPDEAELE